MTSPVPPRDQVVRVDLDDRSVAREPVPERWRRRFVGGKGLGARLLFDALDPGVDPLGPDNVLVFALGPLTGLLPGEDRYAAITRSPLTGGFLDSYAGGSFPGTLAGALPRALAVTIEGRADAPVRLSVADGAATVEPATTWGADAATVAGAYPDAAVACVGPAGEAGVRYATIASDGGDHQAGRGGAGAVMGAKRLKAVVARGTPPSGLDALRERVAAELADSATGRWLAASGTVETVEFVDETGILPTRGWQDGRFEGVDGVGVDAIRELATGREYDRPSDGGDDRDAGADDDRDAVDGPGDPGGDGLPGDFRVPTEGGETVPRGAASMSLGAGLGIDDGAAVAALGGVCDRLGVDLIDAGSAVAWTIRAREAGVLDDAALEGLPEPSFGDADAARALVEAIAGRETPLADALADGVDAAARRYGGTDGAGGDLVPTVKSMALPAYDPRGAASMALAYATSDRGACHRRALPATREAVDPEPWGVDRTVATVIDEQNRTAALWCLIADDLVGTGETFPDLGADWLAALELDVAGDLRTVGERVWTLTRLFNVREGVSRADDALPAALRRPLASGPNAGRSVDPDRFEALLDAYYEARGWGPDGRPTRALVDRLDLAEAVDADGRTPLADDGT